MLGSTAHRCLHVVIRKCFSESAVAIEHRIKPCIRPAQANISRCVDLRNTAGIFQSWVNDVAACINRDSARGGADFLVAVIVKHHNPRHFACANQPARDRHHPEFPPLVRREDNAQIVVYLLSTDAGNRKDLGEVRPVRATIGAVLQGECAVSACLGGDKAAAAIEARHRQHAIGRIAYLILSRFFVDPFNGRARFEADHAIYRDANPGSDDNFASLKRSDRTDRSNRHAEYLSSLRTNRISIFSAAC